ncbi:hypothetical protein CHS0354_041638 [Potamilus streckersoni]|uniref:Uncharacterized protein n=1 Tax=Potamilus streckersoni TaxID=2493646 RepID=A0AAE0VTJ0_9BIVA|nr:hypothetical protein CHS0354_041638 [Potamilus streckersoni]
MSVSIVKVCVCLTLIAALTTETKGLFMLRPARSRNADIEGRNPSDQVEKYTKKYYPYTAPRGGKRTTELNRMGRFMLRPARSIKTGIDNRNPSDQIGKYTKKYNPYTAPRGGKRTTELNQMGYKSYLPEEEKRAGFFVFPRLGRAMSFAFPRLGRANQIHEEVCCNGYCTSPARCCDGFVEGKTNSEDFPFVLCYPALNVVPSEIMGN